MKRPTKADIQSFFRSDRAILMACIGIALIFWLLVKLSQNFKTSDEFAISYILSEGKTFTETPPQAVRATLSGKGWDLISNHFNTKNIPITFELSESPKQNINASLLIDKIQQQVSTDIEVSDVNVDFIYIEIENQSGKKVPVILNSDLSFAPLFHLTDSLVPFPDSITINGPYTEVSAITSWPTEVFKRTDINANATENIALMKPANDQLLLQFPEVSFEIKVEEYTEESLFVPITIKNAPDSLNIKLFPEKIRLSYIAGLSKIESINSSSFVLEVDIQGIPFNTEKNTAPVYVAEQPNYVKGIQLSSQSVEFFFSEHNNAQQDSTLTIKSD